MTITLSIHRVGMGEYYVYVVLYCCFFMVSNISETRVLDIKSGSITLPILKLFTRDIELICEQLTKKVSFAPDFFRDAPILIDISDICSDEQDIVEFSVLVEMLRHLGLAPIGIRGGTTDQHRAARSVHLVVFSMHETTREIKIPPTEPCPSTSIPPVVSVHATKLINQPVRSGQRVYAVGGDLVVLSQVSAGAELMADGNIHVYSTLRGRALAGMQGNVEARIFCTDLQAELVAVGNQYKTSEKFENISPGKPVQIFLQNGELMIKYL